MNTKQLISLLALLCLLPCMAQAKSPWDKNTGTTETAPAETATAEPVAAEPVATESVPAEPEVVQPVTAGPIAPVEPVAVEPVAAEPVATTEPAAPIEVIETSGDVLAMPQPASGQADTTPILLLDFPRRGMDQEKVQSELGKPLEIREAIGVPPITRWIYNDRVVYFERSTVIHVVAR